MTSALTKMVASRTEDAYSFDRYRSWAGVTRVLLNRGLTSREAEAVLRSKWMRWAADAVGKDSNITTAEFIKAMDSMRWWPHKGTTELSVLVLGTYIEENDQ